MDKKNIALGKLTDLVSRLSPKTQTFLYYLPQLLNTPEFSNINPENAVKFTELALKDEQSPIIKDALKVLNRVVNIEDGSLKMFSKDMFYENNSFFWRELGEHTKTPEVIAHIFNKIIFSQLMGER